MRRAALRRGAFAAGSLLCAIASARCTVDQGENPAYRACSSRADCSAAEHCYRGYCLSDGNDTARGAIEGERGAPRGEDAAAPATSRDRSARDAASGAAAAGAPATPPPSSAASDASMSTLPPSSPSQEPVSDAGMSMSPPPVTPADAGSAGAPPPPPPPAQTPADAGAPPEDPPPPASADPCRKSGPEICNGQDDDCDHEADEGFSLQSDATNCGSCGHVCGGGAACCAGQCVAIDTSAHCGACDRTCTGLLQACCDGTCKTLCLL